MMPTSQDVRSRSRAESAMTRASPATVGWEKSPRAILALHMIQKDATAPQP